MKRQQRKDLSKLHLFDLKKSLEWCKTTLGIAPLKEVPRVRRNNKLLLEFLLLDEEENIVELRKDEVYGAYDCDANTIYINVTIHECIPSLARTFIHEYVHYLQNLCVDGEVDKPWDPEYTLQEVYHEDGGLIEDSLIENEAEYHAVKRYIELMNYLGYDYTHS